MFMETLDLTTHRREGVCFQELTEYAARRTSVHQSIGLSYRMLSRALVEALVAMDEERAEEFLSFVFERLGAEAARDEAEERLAEFYLQTFRGMLNDRADAEARTPARAPRRHAGGHARTVDTRTVDTRASDTRATDADANLLAAAVRAHDGREPARAHVAL